MPTIPATPWGHWGSPSPVTAWDENGQPELHGSTGGELKPGYADTLKWYYRKAKHPQDKQHCLKLLTKLEIQKRQRQQHSAQSRRPQTAPKHLHVQKTAQQKLCVTRSASHRQTTHQLEAGKHTEAKSSYQKQLAASQRLSRPRTVKYKFEETTVNTAQARPKSAMANLGRRRVTDPYLTSNQSDFPGYPSHLYAEAVRPMTARGAINPEPLSTKIGPTTFDEQFPWRVMPRAKPIRSGTASGARQNNPQPSEEFLVWRIPRKNAKNFSAAPAKNRMYQKLSDQVMNQIIADKMKSTYKNDFLGIPQGFQVKEAIDCPIDWRDVVPQPRDSTCRATYKNDPQEPELVGNTTRYGCNAGKNISAVGIVPTVTRDHVKNSEVIKRNTTYMHFFESKHRQLDIDRLMKQQDNQKVMNSFLRYARVQDQDAKGEKTM